MARTIWNTPLVLGLVLAATVGGQTPPATPLPHPVPFRPGERLITVQELNQSPQSCRVLQTWRTPEDVQAYQVQSLDTGEMMTIVESGALVTPSAQGRPHERRVATRIFHWGRYERSPAGIPVPPSESSVVTASMQELTAEKLPPGETRFTPAPVKSRTEMMAAPAPAPALMPVAEKMTPADTRVVAPVASGSPQKPIVMDKGAPIHQPVVQTMPAATAPVAQMPDSPPAATERRWPTAHAGQPPSELNAMPRTAFPVVQREPSPAVPPPPAPAQMPSRTVGQPVVIMEKTSGDGPITSTSTCECLPTCRPSLLQRIFRRDRCKCPSCESCEQIVVIQETPEGQKPVVIQQMPKGRQPVYTDRWPQNKETVTVRPEPSKTFQDRPVARVPTMSAEKSDWRKSWRNDEPSKPEVSRVVPEQPVVRTPYMQQQDVVKTPSTPEVVGTVPAPLVKTPKVPTPPTSIGIAPTPSQVPVVKTPTTPETMGPATPVVKTPSMPEVVGTVPAPIVKTPTVPTPPTSIGVAPNPSQVPVVKTPTTPDTIVPPPSPVVKTPTVLTPPTAIGPVPSQLPPYAVKTPSVPAPPTSIGTAPSTLPEAVVTTPSKPQTPTAQSPATTTPMAKGTEPGSATDTKRPGLFRNLFKKPKGKDPVASKPDEQKKLDPASMLPPEARVVTTEQKPSGEKPSEASPKDEGKRGGWFRNMLARPDDKKPEQGGTKTPSTLPQASEIAKAPDAGSTADTKRKGWIHIGPRKSDAKKPEATAQVQEKTSKPSDWGSTGRVTESGPMTTTVKKSEEPALPYARTLPDADPLARSSDYLRRKAESKISASSIPEARTVTVAKKSEDAIPVEVKTPVVSQSAKKDTGPPPGARSVLDAGRPQFLPVPIVTVPNQNQVPSPPMTVPQAPMPNNGLYAPVNPQLTPPPGYANAFTRPGPQRPVPAETLPPEGTVNAFTDPGPQGQGTPPPVTPALLQHSPGRILLTGGYPQGPMQGCPPQGDPMQPIPQGMPPQLPTASLQAHQPAMPVQPMGMNTNAGVPGVAWMPSPNHIPANYFNMPQAAQVNVYNSPQAMAQANSNVLLKMLQESDYPSQREWAAEQLAEQGTRSSPAVVTALLTSAKEDPAPMVRTCCVRGLVKIGAQTMPVANALQQLQNDTDPRVRDAATEAMHAMGIIPVKKNDIQRAGGSN